MTNHDALFRLGAWLQQTSYRFVTGTPATHARVNARPEAHEAKSLHDVFGRSRSFRPTLLPHSVLTWLEQGECLEHRDGLMRSKVRFSSLGDCLFMHSAYPTADSNAVFFGPDTYRFAALIRQTLAASVGARADCVVDVGCGGAAGGMIGALVGMGIPEYEAKLYDGKIRGGNALISVHAENSNKVKNAKEIFKRAGAEDIHSTSEASVPS